MILSKIFQRFVEKTPVSVMARAAMEHALAPEALDALFDKHADRQYTRELLFSSLLDLMTLVVCKVAPSMHAAYQQMADALPVSITSVYNKLNQVEPGVTAAMVTHTFDRLAPVIDTMDGRVPELLPGYRVRILDGNHLAATERRLEVLHRSKAGPLPGHALVVLDPSLMLVSHMIPCEDGHAQERSLFGRVAELVEPNDLWIADRNFCTSFLLSEIDKRNGTFIIRQHANFPIESSGTMRSRGRIETGSVYEQPVTFITPDGNTVRARRIVVRLDKPTRDGDAEISILTNLPISAAKATKVACLYRERWTEESMFQSLTVMLEGEICTLGYPRAALFGFGVALAAYNVLSTVQAALRSNFGAEKIAEEVSSYYIAHEVRAMTPGMLAIVESENWERFQTIDPSDLAKEMLEWASHVRLGKFKRHPRGPKKPVPKRDKFKDKTHVSTARLLAKSRKKSP